MPSRVDRSQARYIPHTIMSPCAKFTTRMTPKMRLSPTAIRLMTPPNSSPLSRPWATRTGSRSAGASGLRPREDELLESGLPGPDGDGLLAEDLDHGRDRVGVVAELVEVDGAAVLHEAGRH